MRTLHVAELHAAYVFDCEMCGRENFQRAITVRLSPDDPDDLRAIRGLFGLDDDEALNPDLVARATTRPDRVTCKHCGVEFEAADDSDSVDDPDEDE